MFYDWLIILILLLFTSWSVPVIADPIFSLNSRRHSFKYLYGRVQWDYIPLPQVEKESSKIIRFLSIFLYRLLFTLSILSVFWTLLFLSNYFNNFYNFVNVENIYLVTTHIDKDALSPFFKYNKFSIYYQEQCFHCYLFLYQERLSSYLPPDGRPYFGLIFCIGISYQLEVCTFVRGFTDYNAFYKFIWMYCVLYLVQ